ncbi:MAG TPA: hypothetical protein VFQ39_19250 [Longimicrobium sp.]|nr:hypothetical protein [Longimicrobium sp.]
MEDRTTTSSLDARDATVKHLRETAAARVENTSLRRVAREIGMSPTGLKKFLMGTAPYSPTLRRLRKWYLQHAAIPAGEVGHQDASAALAVLTHDLAPDPKQAALNEILDSLVRGYEATGRTRPRWVNELRAEYGSRRVVYDRASNG